MSKKIEPKKKNDAAVERKRQKIIRQLKRLGVDVKA